MRVVAIALLVLLLIGAAPAASAADAAAVTRVGWWSRSPAATAPADGVDVGAAADGSSTAVAAFEVAASGSLERAIVNLTEAGGVQQDGAQLQVCPTPNAWSVGANQAMADAPKAECDRGKVALTRNAASSSWAGDVTALLSEIGKKGVVSLMIVPAGAGAVPVGFDVQFAKPQIQAELAPTTTNDTSSFDAGSGSTGSSSSSGSDFSASTGASTAPDGYDSSGSSASTSPLPTTAGSSTLATNESVAPDTVAGAATDSAVIATTTNSGELAALPTPVHAPDKGNHALQAAFFVALAALVGAGAGTGRWILRRREASSALG